MDNKERFTNKAKAYTLGRSSYADSFIDYIFSTLGFSSQSQVADIGSGTGKFSKQLLEKGCTVFCVEPNDDMRLVAENELQGYKNFISVNGDATNTKLADNSVDFVTAAQSFHWFDVKKFALECERILKCNGKVLLIWNSRDMQFEINKEIFALNMKFCPEFKGFSAGMTPDDERINLFFGGKYDKATFPNPQFCDEVRFTNRLLSSSYSLKPQDKNYSEYLNEIKRIFNKFQSDGVVRLENSTNVYIGKPDF